MRRLRRQIWPPLTCRRRLRWRCARVAAAVDVGADADATRASSRLFGGANAAARRARRLVCERVSERAQVSCSAGTKANLFPSARARASRRTETQRTCVVASLSTRQCRPRLVSGSLCGDVGAHLSSLARSPGNAVASAACATPIKHYLAARCDSEQPTHKLTSSHSHSDSSFASQDAAGASQ